jgi:hypothetical protein
MNSGRGPMYYVFCRLYSSPPQPPQQCLGPTCHLTNTVSPVGACLSIWWARFRETHKKTIVGLLVFNPLWGRVWRQGRRGRLCGGGEMVLFEDPLDRTQIRETHRERGGWEGGGVLLWRIFIERGKNKGRIVKMFMFLAGYTVKIYYSWPGSVWLVTSRLGTGKSLTFFYSV